jgi:hypothetical protein
LKVTRFDQGGALIIIKGTVWGPRDRRELNLVLDTGAAESTIAPSILDDLGYNPRQGEAITTVRSAVAAEPGYLLRVARFRALGHEFSDFRVHAHDLPEGFGIDGLLGLSFLRHFNYEIRSAEGRINADRIPSSG